MLAEGSLLASIRGLPLSGVQAVCLLGQGVHLDPLAWPPRPQRSRAGSSLTQTQSSASCHPPPRFPSCGFTCPSRDAGSLRVFRSHTSPWYLGPWCSSQMGRRGGRGPPTPSRCSHFGPALLRMGPVPARAGQRVTVTKLLGLSGEENIRCLIRDLIMITGRNHFGMGSKHFFLLIL